MKVRVAQIGTGYLSVPRDALRGSFFVSSKSDLANIIILFVSIRVHSRFCVPLRVLCAFVVK